MKNLYLLPTNKPSRLHDYNYISLLGLSKEYLQWRQGMHIYITSDEDVKDNEYGICLNLVKEGFKSHQVVFKMDLEQRQAMEGLGGQRKAKVLKVILTTDPELIEDGVQLVSDKFLKWFVKNPSCENVDIVKGYITGGRAECGWATGFGTQYKTIIPKEKVKYEARVLSIEEVMSERSSAYEFIGFDKKETLEEAAKSFAWEYEEEYNNFTEVQKGFIAGAKWQQERI